MLSFSIIVCAHNPNQQTFSRLLDSMLQFKNDAPSHEVIIVDNNSLPVLANIDCIKSFLRLKKNTTIIREEKEGLTAARIAGISKAAYDWIIFFDDDNHPAPDYLINAENSIHIHPNAGAFGPGNVNVVFPTQQYQNKFQKLKYIFQERHEKDPIFSRDKWWQDWYPTGTGLVVRQDVAKKYADHVLMGDYLLSDRKGKMLSSGGDLQIVLTAIKMGYEAGLDPNLKMDHLIIAEKLHSTYLKKLSFGTAESNVPGHLQVWGNQEIESFRPPTSRQILNQIYYHLKVKLRKEGLIRMKLSMCSYLGTLQSLYDLNPSIKPSVYWYLLCKIFQVK
jgi:glycosyltransferase involved in cell wall biosynthesis